MASLSYSTHPSSQTSYSFTVAKGKSDSRYFYFIPIYYVTSLTDINTPLQMSNSNADTQYCWNNSCAWNDNNYTSGSNRNTWLKNNFNKNKQILCARLQCTNIQGTSSRTFNLTAPTISAQGNIQTLNTIAAGDLVDNADMTALKNYLDGYCSGADLSDYIIATLSAGVQIRYDDLESYVNKANALPHVNNLSMPTQGSTITAAYYNNIVNKVKP